MKSKLSLAISSIILAVFFFVACVDKTPTQKDPIDSEALTSNQEEEHGTEVKAGDVEMTNPLNAEWVLQGKAIYEVKCLSCHKLSNEKLVGPGWDGLTKKRKPEWILNMITNVEMMLESDPEAQKLLEECLVRMPNQNLSLEEARQVYEFMRSIDGEK